MKLRTIIRIVGLLVLLFSVFILLPGLIAIIYRDGSGTTFVKSFFLSVIIGFILWFPNRYKKSELKMREGFLIVVLFWVVLGAISAMPFLIDHHIDLTPTNAFFEAFSSLTTTGGTIFRNLDDLPHALVFYRLMLQWLGGMGIIVLAVAVLPLLGVGGMQIYRAEIPGPEKNNRVQPRVAQIAKTLWLIYLGLTFLCAFCLWLAGMDVFDAICHGFAILALSGSSTYSSGLAYFDSDLINYIAIFFIILAACNFNLHFVALHTRSFRSYLRDQEFRFFISILSLLVLVVFIALIVSEKYSLLDSFNAAIFHSASMMSTSGFAVKDLSTWPAFLTVLLFFSSFIGGCAGSTGGGLKVVRCLLLYLQGYRELKRLVHPQSIYAVKLGKRILPEKVIEAVWGFFSAYCFIFVISLLLIMATGVDMLSAFSAVTAGLNNLGSGLGIVADTFNPLNDIAKWIMVIDMLFGRLEIFTLLVILTPTFWRS